MYELKLYDLEKFIGTNTLIHVKVNDFGYHKDLFIACEHLYAKVNGEYLESKETREQVEHIIRSFYNIKEDRITDFYANLEDSYRPQYTTRINDKIKDYKVLEFEDYKLPYVDLIESLLDEDYIEIDCKKESQRLKLELMFKNLDLINKARQITKYPKYVVNNQFYYDLYAANFDDTITCIYSYPEIYDLGFKNYYKK